MAFLHEMGHFQTAPLAVLWLATNTSVASAAGNLDWVIGTFLLVNSHTAWKILAETFVIVSNGPFYRQCYMGTSTMPRLLFWMSAAAVSVAGWIVPIC